MRSMTGGGSQSGGTVHTQSLPIRPADSLPSRVPHQAKNTPKSHGVAQQKATPCDVSLHITWCGKARVAETAIFQWPVNGPGIALGHTSPKTVKKRMVWYRR